MSLLCLWGPPQSGKTTLTLDLALAISRTGVPVLVISPEKHSELSALLGVEIREHRGLSEALRLPDAAGQIAVCVEKNFSVLAASTVADPCEAEPSVEAVRLLLESCRKQYAVILVDCPARPSDTLSAWSMRTCEALVLLTGCGAVSKCWWDAYALLRESLWSKTVPVCVQCLPEYAYSYLHKLLHLTDVFELPHVPFAYRNRFLYSLPGREGRKYTQALDALLDRLKEVGA